MPTYKTTDIEKAILHDASMTMHWCPECNSRLSHTSSITGRGDGLVYVSKNIDDCRCGWRMQLDYSYTIETDLFPGANPRAMAAVMQGAE